MNNNFLDSFHEEQMIANAKAIAEQERRRLELAEQRRQEREEQFQKQLKRLNAQDRKKAERQKRIDARINQKIIQASKQKLYYKVLGLRSPSRNHILSRLFRPSQQDIKKAFRKMAKRVHPDKNKDGRAEEAFRMLEESSAFLMDESLRAEYDEIYCQERGEQWQRVFDSLGSIIRQSGFVVRLTYRIVKPFSTPLAILGCLII